MTPKKKQYMWMDGQLRDTPDPNWNQAEAIRLGLIPAPVTSGGTPVSSNFSALKADADFTRRALNLETAEDHTADD